MFGRLIRTCAATLLLGSSALAVDVAGTFSAQTPQGPLSIELRPDAGHLSGTVHYANHDFPIVAGQSGDRVIGVWQADGAAIPIQGSFDGTVLTLTTNGATYRLQRSAAVVPTDNVEQTKWRPIAGDVPSAAPIATDATAQPSAPAAEASPLIAADVQMQIGRVFSYPAPRGWRISENDAGVDLLAPDGATAVSHTLIRGVGAMSPDAILQTVINVAPQIGMRNVRVVSSQRAPAELNGIATAYELTYEFNGTPVRALGIYTVYPQPGGAYFAETITLQAPPATFKRDVQTLLQLAQNIAISNVNGAFGNGRLIHLQPQAGNPIGDMIVKGEEARNRMRAAAHLHADDAIRGQVRYETADGTQITAPTDAARVFNTPGGNASYTTHYNDPPPANAEEAHPYNYNR